MSKSEETTLIVGAGIAGLTAAHLLSQQGEKCVVLEKDKEIGGLCRTFKMDDVTFDLGPHYFFDNPDLEAERLMMSLLEGHEVIKRKFRFAIRDKGRQWRFPVCAVDMLLHPGEYSLRLLTQFLSKRKKPRGGMISAEREIVDKFGAFYYQNAIGPMLAKKTLYPGSQIHHHWMARLDRDVNNAKEPFRGISRIQHILRGIRVVLWPKSYLYPAAGHSFFVEKLCEKFRQSGGRIILDCGKITFKTEGDYIRKVVANGTKFPASNVVWTGSINDLNDVIGSDAPKIEYLKVIIVLLSYNQANRASRPFAYIYYPNQNLIFNRIYYPSSIYGAKSPPGREGICFELNYKHQLDELTDEEIVTRTVAEADKCGLLGKDTLRQSTVIRLGECLPVYNLGYEAEMERTFRDVHRFKNLFSVGRLGGYLFCMTPKAVNQGIKMAGHLLQNS